MSTLWKVAALTLVAASVAGCYSRTTTREVVREQPIVQQQQPVIEHTTVVQEPRVIERDRVVVVPRD